MTNIPRVDILLSTYNGSRYLPEFFQSIARQTHHNWKLLIRDDGSTDGTISEIVAFSKEFPDKVMFNKANIEHIGVLQSYSQIALLSSSKYIMFADQDDVWLPGKISMTLDAIIRMEKTSTTPVPLLVHTDLMVVDDSLFVMAESFWIEENLNPGNSQSFLLQLTQNYVTGCTIMVNRALLDMALPFPEKAVMHDWWLVLVANAFGAVQYLPRATILYRQHANNVVGATPKGSARLMRVIQKIIDMRGSVGRSEAQAKEFYCRYKGSNAATSCISDAFAYGSIRSHNSFYRMVIALRHGFRKGSLLRTIGLYISL